MCGMVKWAHARYLVKIRLFWYFWPQNSIFRLKMAIVWPKLWVSGVPIGCPQYGHDLQNFFGGKKRLQQSPNTFRIMCGMVKWAYARYLVEIRLFWYFWPQNRIFWPQNGYSFTQVVGFRGTNRVPPTWVWASKFFWRQNTFITIPKHI
jgi:hypothetical protein